MILGIYAVSSDTLSDNDFDFLLSFSHRGERILRQRVRQNACNMLIGDVLAGFAIKDVFSVPIKEQKYGVGENGKPFLIGKHGIFFNVSHSESLVVCAVSDTEVGVDIEAKRRFTRSLAERVCSEDEMKKILESSDCDAEFCRLWTAKEAYVKMKGTGIGCDLRKINCSPDISLDIGDYFLSVCCE